MEEAEIRIKEINGKKFIFDPLRKKFVALTPEEGVRQQWLNFLVYNKNYPAYLIGIETSLKLNGTSKRADILIYDNKGKPSIMIECKAPHIKLSQITFDQVARYNMVFKVDYLIVTNGESFFICKMDYENSSHHYLKEIPEYKSE